MMISGVISCVPKPSSLIPWFIFPDQDVSSDSCKLVAYVPEEVAGDYEYGFYFGSTPFNMQKYRYGGPTNLNTISIWQSFLQPNTEYYYMAYANNGYNEVCSELMSLRTLPQ